jgi:hypothetical protein
MNEADQARRDIIAFYFGIWWGHRVKAVLIEEEREHMLAKGWLVRARGLCWQLAWSEERIAAAERMLDTLYPCWRCYTFSITERRTGS